MHLDTVSLTGQDLAKVDNTFATIHPDYTQLVVVVFTAGKKSDPRWAGARERAWGQTRPREVAVDDRRHACTATVLVDLYEILKSSRPPPSTIAGRRVPDQPVSPGGFRYRVVTTIVHELAHVHQGWQLGRRFFRDLAEETMSAQARHQDYADANPGMVADPYLQNAFEAGARDFAARWVEHKGDGIEAGRFDFLLPMNTMVGFFPDHADPFPVGN